MDTECLVHDKWHLEQVCTCSSERKWARKKQLQETLEKIAPKKG